MSTHNSLKMLILGLTGKCNFSCAYCYADSQPQEALSFDTAVRAIDMAAESGQPFVLQFTGGEPLLAFDCIEKITSYVKEKRVPAILQVQTNASLIDRDMALFLKKARVGVGISLDGRPQQNDLLRRLPEGQGTSPLVLRGAEILAAAGVKIGITCVVTESNVKELSGIVEMAYYLGNVRKIGFDLLRAQGRGAAMKAAETSELKAALKEVLSTAQILERKTGKKLIFSHTQRVANLAGKSITGFSHCHAMNGEAAYVRPNGEIYACASLAGVAEFRLGNVNTGIDAQKQRFLGDKIKKNMAFCLACPSFSLCGGGCFARWLGEGLVSKPYMPECVLKKVFINEYQKRGEFLCK